MMLERLQFRTGRSLNIMLDGARSCAEGRVTCLSNKPFNNLASKMLKGVIDKRTLQRSCWFWPRIEVSNKSPRSSNDLCLAYAWLQKRLSSPKLAGFQVRNTALCLRSLSNFHVLRNRPQAFVETSWKSHAFRKGRNLSSPSALYEHQVIPPTCNRNEEELEYKTVEWDGPINHEILSDLIPILWYLLWFSSNKTGDTGCTFYLAQASTGLHSLALQQVADIMTGWSACQTLRRACTDWPLLCLFWPGNTAKNHQIRNKYCIQNDYIYIYIKATRLCGRLLQSFEKAIQLLILLLPHNRYGSKTPPTAQIRTCLRGCDWAFLVYSSI